MITPQTIQTIIDTAKIEEVVGDFMQLKRRGVNYIGLCPFHGEKSPSFSVNPTRNIFKCFGCGEGGGSVNFVMKHENISYPDALRYIAKKYNIEIVEEKRSEEFDLQKQEQDALYLVNDVALAFYQDQLNNTDMGKSVGLTYWRGRGFTDEIIKKWGLGFAPDESDALVRHAGSKGYKVDLLKKAGLAGQQAGRDFFRNRVMFTIHNLSGKIVGFAGRIMVNDKKLPKYVNTPETEIYNKSRILFGAYFARQAIRKQDECFLTEGYTDVMSLHQAGIENVVASSGTSLTTEQVGIIKRLTPNITILYDGDAAGIKAALRGLDMVLAEDMNVRVVLLPDGEDPDSYCRKLGAEAFLAFITAQKQDFIVFKMNLLLADAAGDPLKKAALVKDIVLSVAKIPDYIKRSFYIKECSSRLGIGEEALMQELNKILKQDLEKAKSSAAATALNNTNRQTSSPQPKKTNPNPQPPKDQAPWPPFDNSPFPDEFNGGGNFDMPPLTDMPDEAFMGTDSSFGAGDDNFWMGMEADASFGASGIPEEDFNTAVVENTSKNYTQGNEYQEKDLVRLVMEFGHRLLEGQKTVGQYIVAELFEVVEEFDNKFYSQVLNEYFSLIIAGKNPDSSFWINHPDPQISQFSINILSTPYEYSDRWKVKFDVQTRSPEENFKRDVINGMNRFKLRMIERQRSKLMAEMKNLPTEEMMEKMKLIMHLDEMKKQLSKVNGGTVTSNMQNTRF